MKFYFQALKLLLIRIVFSTAIPGVPVDALVALGRDAASVAEHFHPAPISASSHSIDALSMDQIMQLVRFYNNQDLAPLLNSPEFRELLKDKQTAAQIYNEVKGFADKQIKQELKIMFSDYKFPANAEEMTKIVLPIKLSETAEVIVKSPEFKKMTEDFNSLEALIFTIRVKKSLGQPTVWDPYYKELNNKYQEENYARFTLAELKENKGKTIRLQELEPLPAKLSRAESMDEIVNLIKVLRDDDTLNLIEHSKAYERIIQDPFKASQLKRHVIGIPWDQSLNFFETLRRASVRKYRSVQDVLVTLRDLKFATADSDLTKFRPYNDFTNNPGNAKKILTAIENDPRSYTAFKGNRLVFDTLKAKANQ